MNGPCLVTGARGFVGRAIVAALLEQGREVVALTSSEADPAVNATAWRRMDLMDRAGVQAVLDDVRPEILVHAAWDTKHGAFWTSDANYKWVTASLGLLEAFRASGGRRIVTVGSCAEYDWNHGFCSEGVTPLEPWHAYGECKAALYRMTMRYAREHDLSAAWARIFLVYGPHEDRRRLVPSLACAMLAGRLAESSAGTQLRDFLHADDCGRAIAQLATTAVTGPVNIGSGVARTIAEVARMIAATADRPELLRLGALPMRPDDPPVLLPDVRRLVDEVGFRPRHDLQTGIADAMAWWRENAPH